jgi:RNA polymerase sigma-70 factor (ECF subfamily)
MTQAMPSIDTTFDRFRTYLRLLAEAHLDRRFHAKLEASDVVQQTLMEAYEKREQFAGHSEAQLAGWLRQALVHNIGDAIRCLGRVRRDISRERSLDAAIENSFSRAEQWLASAQTSPSQHAVRSEELLQLADSLAELPDAQRESVVLHHLQGWTLTELAQHMGRSESAVAGLLHRGLKRLRELVEGHVTK